MAANVDLTSLMGFLDEPVAMDPANGTSGISLSAPTTDQARELEITLLQQPEEALIPWSPQLSGAQQSPEQSPAMAPSGPASAMPNIVHHQSKRKKSKEESAIDQIEKDLLRVCGSFGSADWSTEVAQRRNAKVLAAMENKLLALIQNLADASLHSLLQRADQLKDTLLMSARQVLDEGERNQPLHIKAKSLFQALTYLQNAGVALEPALESTLAAPSTRRACFS